MFYMRVNKRVFFLVPTVACGLDVDNRAFFEIAWFCIALGVGEA